MRYVTLVFWALILGQMVGFLGAKLTSSAYSAVGSLIISLVVAIIVCILDGLMKPQEPKSAK